MDRSQKIALVSGAKKGLGFEISKQLAQLGMTVIMTDHDEAGGRKSAETLKNKGLDVVFFPMEITELESIRRAREFVEKDFGRADVLINNAGIFIDNKLSGLEVDAETVLKTFKTNTLGHLLVSQAFIPLMKKNRYGRIVNMASGLGTLDGMGGGYPSYSISKTALNAVTSILAAETKGTGILINSMCPGWCRTDMGGALADRSPEKGAETAVYLATLPDRGPTGACFRDKKQIHW